MILPSKFIGVIAGLLSAHGVLIPPAQFLARPARLPIHVHEVSINWLQRFCGDYSNACASQPFPSSLQWVKVENPVYISSYACEIIVPKAFGWTILTDGGTPGIMSMSEWRDIYWHEIAHCHGWEHYPEGNRSMIDGNG